jgi:outer membrane protein OmpA-like peptidoglycan-associated protein
MAMTVRLIALALLLVMAGCGLPSNVVVLIPDENGAVGKLAVHEGASTAELDRPLAAVNAGSEASVRNVFTAQRADVDSEFSGALAATPRAPLVYILYFQTGLTELDPRSRGDLSAATAAVKGTSNVDVSVVGHADATGSDAYNSALSLKRAQTIRDSLVAAGIPNDVIEVDYHGANNPLIPTPGGVAEPRNRRVEVTIR